jgi:hypothetical protein
MMQTAEPWHGYNLVTCARIRFCFTTRWSLLLQTEVRAIFVVIADVIVHQALQMPFIENDHMVEQIAAAVANPALGDPILPGASEAGPLGLDAEGLYGVDNLFIELRAVIEDQITWRRVVGKRLAQLLDNPCAGRMPCDIAVQDTSPVMGDDEEAVENAKSQRRHGKEIHCRDGFTMVAQKGRPALCRLGTPRRFPHPAQYGSLRNLEAKHFQLTVNARSSPGRVLDDHTEDEFAQFFADAFSSHLVPMTRKPRPIQLESCPMPANDGLRLDEDQRPSPSRPKPPQDHPEQFVRRSESRLRVLLFQDSALLPKGQVFQHQVAARADRVNEQVEQQLQRTEHEPVLTEASRISMQTAFGSCPLHGLHYPTKKTRVPVSPRGLSAEGRLCRQYGMAPLIA